MRRRSTYQTHLRNLFRGVLVLLVNHGERDLVFKSVLSHPCRGQTVEVLQTSKCTDRQLRSMTDPRIDLYDRLVGANRRCVPDPKEYCTTDSRIPVTVLFHSLSLRLRITENKYWIETFMVQRSDVRQPVPSMFLDESQFPFLVSGDGELPPYTV